MKKDYNHFNKVTCICVWDKVAVNEQTRAFSIEIGCKGDWVIQPPEGVDKEKKKKKLVPLRRAEEREHKSMFQRRRFRS